jgi:uncharacterized membrane protein YfcA
MISLPFFAVLAPSVLFTSFLSGVFGMAGGMILMGILVFILPVAAAMVLHGLTQMTANVWRAWLWRASIRWRPAAFYAAGSVLAALAFAAIAASPSKAVALIIIGMLPFIALLLPQRLAPDVLRGSHGFACGAMCTALQFLAGVSGPILDVFFVRSDLDRKEMVATKAAVQAMGHFLKAGYFGHLLLGSNDAVAPAVIVLGIVLALIGTQLSRHALEAIGDAQFRNWSRRLIVAVAAIYLIQGVSLFAIDLYGNGARDVVAAISPRTAQAGNDNASAPEIPISSEMELVLKRNSERSLQR